MHRITHITLTLLGALLPLSASAQGTQGGQNTNTTTGLLEQAGKEAQFKTATGSAGLAGIVGTLINVFLSILGVVFLVLVVYGGYLWMIARGNDELVTKAKDTIRNGVIGLIIVLGSYAISQFVVSGLVRATTTQ